MMRRLKRDYHRSGPAAFLSFVQKVKHCLTNNPNYPESGWGANIEVLRRFFETVVRFELAYRLASNGDKLLIRDRDKLMEELIVLLDTIASLLEAASAGNPDALLTTGFSVAQERRKHNREKLPLTSPVDFVVVNSGETRKAIASASSLQGALNQEIHCNRRDPSVETDWFHKAIFPNAANMALDNLEPGNTFFRMRYHGPDGPGPWSSTTSVTIT